MNANFLTDEKGRKVAVVLPIEEYTEMLEDLSDLAAIARQRDEKGIPFEDVMKQLKLRLSKGEPVRN